jgi:hypothetical protein
MGHCKVFSIFPLPSYSWRGSTSVIPGLSGLETNLSHPGIDGGAVNPEPLVVLEMFREVHGADYERAKSECLG